MMFSPFDMLWFWDPYYYEKRAQAAAVEGAQEMNFLEAGCRKQGVIQNKHATAIGACMTLRVIGNCSCRCADTIRGDRPTCEHLPTSRFRFIVDPASVECMFSITPRVAGFARLKCSGHL